MTRKIFFTATILLTTYSIFVSQFAPRWWRASQHQWQDNFIKAQHFLYDNTDSYQSIIIGSSLSSRLIMDSLPKTYNLTLGGQGIVDGLNILSHKSNLPKNIFIEMNLALRPENKEFTTSLNSPIMFYPRKMIASLREDKQPLAILGLIQIVTIMKLKSLGYLNKKNEKKNPDKSSQTNALFPEMLKLQIAAYSKSPDEEDLLKSFNLLTNYVKSMEDRGANIIFFELPVNPQLEKLPYAVAIRDRFYKYFPRSKYKYVSLPDLLEPETSDGIHLKPDEALKYTIYFKDESKNFIR